MTEQLTGDEMVFVIGLILAIGLTLVPITYGLGRVFRRLTDSIDAWALVAFGVLLLLPIVTFLAPFTPINLIGVSLPLATALPLFVWGLVSVGLNIRAYMEGLAGRSLFCSTQ